MPPAREYSPHARIRMQERKISEADVEAALKRMSGDPRPGDKGRTVVYGYAPGQRILKIVLQPDGHSVHTVMAVGE
jgi:Domain of unknown function (DUF4258)